LSHASVYQLAAPHHLKAALSARRAAHRLRWGCCPEATSQSKGARGLRAPRGALEHRGKARRL